MKYNVRRKTITTLIGLALVAAVVLWNSDNIKDVLVWNEFHKSLNQDQVEEITINLLPDQKIQLDKNEKNELLRLLRDAKFESSNRMKHGSTPDGSLLLQFKNIGISVSYYRGTAGVSSIFELSPRHIDHETQFYIESEALGNFIEAKLPE
ncbi:hypothetical protein J2T17_007154 [Paenibacillus mucilaginosus]|uniref:hypothetical protein n=1 Tax=Paenibacillus mucilaginosus TaxID=61624 RepID=UPI003D1F7EBF